MVARGRPRDPAISGAILQAARALLMEVGYANLSMEAVAARAGVSKPTLYLRFPTRALLVFEAVFGRTKLRTLPSTGSIRTDLYEAYEWLVEEFNAAEARAALPGLLSDLAGSPELGQLIRTAVIGPEYARIRAKLETAQADGELQCDVDLDLVIDAFIGTALGRVILLEHDLDEGFGKSLVDLLLDGAVRAG